ncbi:ankyrin repeat-containing domain protein [Flagelloscypha sp. PMI_526]|nr:ankyrin repeat-containing domain protein [Flagelloscypha sp. PMI_526]
MGTGKTVISSFIIERLLAQDVHVAYYYFEFANPITLSEEALLRSLVCQLACVSPSVMRTLHLKHNKGSLQPQLTTLQDTLNQLISASSKPVFIIIDALDELPLTQRKYLLQSLLTFTKSNNASRIHIMVTSREDVDIHHAFEEKVDFELAVHSDRVRQDIAAFVDRELEAKKWTSWPRDVIEMARRLLNESADGQFRMAACQIDFLQKVKTYKQFKQSLHSLPKTLGETYDYILQKIPEHLRDLSHRLFSILSFALEPISADELSALLAVELGDEANLSQLPRFEEINRMIDPLDVVDLGTSLVSRVDRQGKTCLQLAHASVKEHLLSPCTAWFSLCENLAQSMIARSCLTLLLHFQVFQHAYRDRALYTYSKINWFRHVLPNGSLQLVYQQQQIYRSFPWPFLNDYRYSGWPYKQTNSPLVSAASFGLFDLIVILLNDRSCETTHLAEALVMAASSDLTSPLQAASLAGKFGAVQFLLDSGADVNALGGEHGSALQAGASDGSLDIVRFLVDKGADVNAHGGKYGSALLAGASNERLEIVRFLAEMGADVNASEGYYGSALQAGAWRGSLEIVRFLVEKGAEVNTIGGRYKTALNAAQDSYLLDERKSDRDELVRFLKSCGAKTWEEMSQEDESET